MLYKRKDSSYWWLKITVGNKTIQRSTGAEDKLKAQEYCDKLKAELWAQSKLGDKPSYTWEEAVIKWLEWQDAYPDHFSKWVARWPDIKNICGYI